MGSRGVQKVPIQLENLKSKREHSIPVRMYCRKSCCTEISNRDDNSFVLARFPAPSGDGPPPRVDKDRFQVHFNRGPDSPYGGGCCRDPRWQPPATTSPLKLLLSSFLAQDVPRTFSEVIFAEEKHVEFFGFLRNIYIFLFEKMIFLRSFLKSAGFFWLASDSFN